MATQDAQNIGTVVAGFHGLQDGGQAQGTKPASPQAPDVLNGAQHAPDLQLAASNATVAVHSAFAGSTDRHSWDSKVGVFDVFWMTTVMAAACGLGALPFFFIRRLSKRWAGMASAVACGVMLAASFDLLHEAEGYGSMPLIIGLVVGCLFIKSLQEWLEDYEDVKFEGFSGANAQRILLFVGIMAAHAVGEGSGVGALARLCARRWSTWYLAYSCCQVAGTTWWHTRTLL